MIIMMNQHWNSSYGEL